MDIHYHSAEISTLLHKINGHLENMAAQYPTMALSAAQDAIENLKISVSDFKKLVKEKRRLERYIMDEASYTFDLTIDKERDLSICVVYKNNIRLCEYQGVTVKSLGFVTMLECSGNLNGEKSPGLRQAGLEWLKSIYPDIKIK